MNIDIRLRDFLDFVGFEVECDVYELFAMRENLLCSGFPDDIIEHIDLTQREYKLCYIPCITDGRIHLSVVEV